MTAVTARRYEDYEVLEDYEEQRSDKAPPAARAILVAGESGLILTERDLALAIASGTDPATPVGAVAKRCRWLESVPGEMSILEAGRLLLAPEVGRLVAEDAGGDRWVVSLRGPIKGPSRAC